MNPNGSKVRDGRTTHAAKGARIVAPCPAVTARGRFTLISGCMFSGKTTELIRVVSRAPGAAVLAIKHAIDTRYSPDHIVTHDGKQFAARVLTAARDIPTRATQPIALVAIDEAHFFDDSLVPVIGELTDRGIDVITTTLDRDSWGQPFPIAEQLGGIADRSLRLYATCARCGRRADRTQRRTPICDGQMVGGSESYEARCRRCWRPPPEPRPIV